MPTHGIKLWLWFHLICCWPPRKVNGVSMETLDHFITPPFAFLICPQWFLPFPPLCGGCFIICTCLVFFHAWKYTEDGNSDVVLMYNLHGIMNNLCSLHAFPSAIPALLCGRGWDQWLTVHFMHCNHGSWQGHVKWSGLVRGSVWGNILLLPVSLPRSH